MKRRIYYYDTDCSGAVYHANYLNFFEEARSEFLETRGFTIKELLERGVGFAVRRQEAEYKRPALYGDVLDIETSVKEFTPFRIVFSYKVTNQSGDLVVKAETDLVCVGRDLKLIEIPEEIKASLAAGK
ncbi:MAG: acyl-CoA thioesterase [Elusimicrobia bacterium CG08_land_8_20_14_0_20_59_10]|nr:MAG: acyl-CoA thioesterase [Elusimicrobia bacterium CG08_land_8_20_14_0_20_59_10]